MSQNPSATCRTAVGADDQAGLENGSSQSNLMACLFFVPLMPALQQIVDDYRHEGQLSSSSWLSSVSCFDLFNVLPISSIFACHHQNPVNVDGGNHVVVAQIIGQILRSGRHDPLSCTYDVRHRFGFELPHILCLISAVRPFASRVSAHMAKVDVGQFMSESAVSLRWFLVLVVSRS